MVLTNDPQYAEKARSLRNLCFRPERRFYHSELGYNFRLTNLQAALGLAQLERFEEIVAKKRWMGQAYTERLKDIAVLQLPVEESWAKQVYWMYSLVLDESTHMDAVEFAKHLQALDVQTRPFFLGMHEQPVFLERGLFHGEQYPVAERIARQGLYLPSGLTLTPDQLEQVCDAVRKVLIEA
jgi:perosamine synthetase